MFENENRSEKFSENPSKHLAVQFKKFSEIGVLIV
jgi:hypothetical protein